MESIDFERLRECLIVCNGKTKDALFLLFMLEKNKANNYQKFAVNSWEIEWYLGLTEKETLEICDTLTNKFGFIFLIEFARGILNVNFYTVIIPLEVFNPLFNFYLELKVKD